MNIKLLILLGLLAGLAGCNVEVVDRPHHRWRHEAVVYGPSYVEEGSVLGNAVVQPPPYIDSYVLIRGHWFYWHPQFQCWVHAHRPPGWYPAGNVIVYHSWAQHPMYRADVAVVPGPAPDAASAPGAAPGPVIAPPSGPTPTPAPAPAPAPTYVEEGAVVNGVVVAPPATLDSYVFVGGGWYYWHPQLRCWVHAYRPQGWQAPANVHVYHDWSEHLLYH